MIRQLIVVASIAVLLALPAPLLAQGNQTPSEAAGDNESTETPNDGGKEEGDPVVLASGNLRIEETDMFIAGRGGLDVEIKRTYRSGCEIESGLGPKWDLNWFKRIIVDFPSCGTVPARMYYYDGATRIDIIDENPWTAGVWDMPYGYFAKIRFSDPFGGGFNPPFLEVRHQDGTVYTFGVASKSLWVGGCTTSYWLSRVQDRMGNAIDLQYQTVGTSPNFFSRLWRIIDTYGRPITFDYESTSPAARLTSITDFAGRSVRYDHDSLQRLVTVTTPNVDDGLSQSLGNAYPAGKTTTYQYQNDDTLSPQRFNVTRITDPTGFTFVENEYGAPSTASDEGRVISQIVGGTNGSGVAAGGKYRFIYDFPATPIDHGPSHDDWSFHWLQRGRTVVVSPNGNVSLTVFDSAWGDILNYRFTGRVNPDDPELLTATVDSLVFVELGESEAEALDPEWNWIWPDAPGYTSPLGSDAMAFITMTLRDYHGMVTEVRGPGSHFRFTYNNDYTIVPWLTATPDRFQHGNLLKAEQLTNDDEDPSDPLVTTYLYEPIFNQVRAVVDPRGNDPFFVPPNGGSNSPQRYMKRYFFDYQELDWNSSAIQNGLLLGWGIDELQNFQFGVVGGWILPEMPLDDNQPDLNGDGLTVLPRGNELQRVDPTTNVPVDIGAPTLTFTPQSRVHKYVYNAFSLCKSETDPEGNRTDYSYYPATTPTGGTPSADGGGLLAVTARPEGVSNGLEYDLLGRVTRSVDGRGFATDSAYNALDQLVRSTDADGNTVTHLYDANDNAVETRISNRTPELSATTGLPTGAMLDLPDIKNYFEFDGLDRVVEEDVQAGTGNRLVTRHRYDKEGNRILTLSPEYVAGNDASNVRAHVFDERNLLLGSAEGGLGFAFRDSTYINQAHSVVMAELGTAVVDLPFGELVETYVAYNLNGDLIDQYDGESKNWQFWYDGFNRRIFQGTPGPFGSVGKLYVTDTLDPAGNKTSTEYRRGDNVLIGKTRRFFDEDGRAYQVDRDFFSVGSGVTPEDGLLSPSDDRVNYRTLFDKCGRPVQTIDDNRSLRIMMHDGLGRLVVVADHPDVLGTAQSGVQYTYDDNGNVILSEAVERRASDGTVAYFRKWSFYDKLNRVVARVNNLRHTDRFLYDSRSNRVFQSDADSPDLTPLLPSLDTYGEHTGLPNVPINDHGNVTVFEFDDAGRRLAERRFGSFDGGHIVTSRTFDKNGLVVEELDDSANVTEHEYDSLNRVDRTTFADGTVSDVLAYDRNHNVKELLDQNDSRIVFEYDDSGRVSEKTIYPGPNVAGTQGETESYQYDGWGRLISASDSDSTVTRFYDSMSNVVREDLTHDGLTRTTLSLHDGVGNLTEITYPGGRTVERIHDAWNRLERVHSDGIDVARYSYIGLSRVQQKDLFGIGSSGSPAVSATFTYDAVRRFKTVKHVRTQGSLTIDHRDLAFNREGDKESRMDLLSQVLHEYEYDEAHRMNASNRSVVGQPGHALERSRTYSLDDVGNREQVVTGAQVDAYNMSAVDGPVNQYTNTPPGKWFHDDNGNLTRIKPPGPVVGLPGGGTNQFLFYYDYKNRLVEAWNPSTWTTSEYAYDALDRRIRKTVNGVSTRYFYVGWQDCEEQDGFGTTVATYVYGRGIDEVLSMSRGGSDYVHVADDLGNVTKLADAATGAVVESYDYDDYGQPLDGATLAALPQGSGVGNPFLFTGRRYDPETGLYYYRLRYMDPRSGRFISRDPMGIWGDAANVGNGYTYAGSNPWSYVDPMGLEGETSNPLTDGPKGDVRNSSNSSGDDLKGDTSHHGSASGNPEGKCARGDTAHHGSASRNKEAREKAKELRKEIKELKERDELMRDLAATGMTGDDEEAMEQREEEIREKEKELEKLNRERIKENKEVEKALRGMGYKPGQDDYKEAKRELHDNLAKEQGEKGKRTVKELQDLARGLGYNGPERGGSKSDWKRNTAYGLGGAAVGVGAYVGYRIVRSLVVGAFCPPAGVALAFCP